jgi:hypothetical protein
MERTAVPPNPNALMMAKYAETFRARTNLKTIEF